MLITINRYAYKHIDMDTRGIGPTYTLMDLHTLITASFTW